MCWLALLYLALRSLLAWREIPDPENRSFSLGREMKQHHFGYYSSSRNCNTNFWRSYLMRMKVDCLRANQTEDMSRALFENYILS